MKIAFTSCMAFTVFAQQPVWDQIAAQRPDRLLLLGDSVYIDAPPYPIGMTHPKQMAPVEFLQHVLHRWRTQLDQPQFRALVSAVPTDAIWDEIIELEISLAPGNRIQPGTNPGDPGRRPQGLRRRRGSGSAGCRWRGARSPGAPRGWPGARA